MDIAAIKDKVVAKIKGAVKSVTVWFNTVSAAIIAGLPSLQDAVPQIQQYIPELKWLAGGIIVGNILLRFRTNKDLSQK